MEELKIFSCSFVVDRQHVAEIPFENDWVVTTRKVEHGTVTHLENIGVLGKNLLAAHSVWVSPEEVPIFQPLAFFLRSTASQRFPTPDLWG